MRPRPGATARERRAAVLKMGAVFAAVYLIGYAFRWVGFPDTNIAAVFLLAAPVTVWLTNMVVFGLIASFLSSFAFNYFFVEPLFTFSVNDPKYVVTFIIMTLTAVCANALTSHAKNAADEARANEADTVAVYHLTNRLNAATDMHEVSGVAAAVIGERFSCNAACLCFDEAGAPERAFAQYVFSDDKIVFRESSDTDAIARAVSGLKSGYADGGEFLDWVVVGSENALGLIRIPKDGGAGMNQQEQRTLRSMIESVAMAMDRQRSALQRQKLREEAAIERYRANLLSSISHDIRTPLSAIIGSADVLMRRVGGDSEAYSLAQGIYKDADWLRSLVENILSLARLRDGRFAIEKRPEAVEEVVGEAVSHASRSAPEREISVKVPDELLFWPMDAKLIKQALINLIDNAIKHTPGEIEVEAAVGNGLLRFAVMDRGDGIRDEDLPRIFSMFYTGSEAGGKDAGDRAKARARRGVGLGLSICETVVAAHGGTIEAAARPDGRGSVFTFSIP